MGLPGIEPGTSRLSGVRSNRLSYKPTRGVLEGCPRKSNSISRIKRNVNYTSEKQVCQINLGKRSYGIQGDRIEIAGGSLHFVK